LQVLQNSRGEKVAEVKERIEVHLQQSYPTYESCVVIAKAVGCTRSTAHTALSKLTVAGLVQKKNNAAPGPKQSEANPLDPMPNLRRERVIGWRLKK
jgi:predicted ArsR family transcriptional regulator